MTDEENYPMYRSPWFTDSQRYLSRDSRPGGVKLMSGKQQKITKVK